MLNRIGLNFLAHQYLSGDDPNLKIGNFIADFVRGSDFENYSESVQEGILLHRKIDTFTDQHPQVKRAVELIRPSQKKYSPVVVDIMFDHFLAANWQRYHSKDLNLFAHEFYDLLLSYKAPLPEALKWILPRMKQQNWLYEYQYLDGIQQAFEGMSRRASFKSRMSFAGEDLKENYEDLNECFELFFEEIVNYVKDQGVSL